MRRLVLAVVVLLAAGVLLAQTSVSGDTRVKVGVLKLTSSAPIFIGVEKGFFQEFGITPELVYFQAAHPSQRRSRPVSST
jgi:NitT/TauT family transport system substrate-binding protein